MAGHYKYGNAITEKVSTFIQVHDDDFHDHFAQVLFRQITTRRFLVSPSYNFRRLLPTVFLYAGSGRLLIIDQLTRVRVIKVYRLAEPLRKQNVDLSAASASASSICILPEFDETAATFFFVVVLLVAGIKARVFSQVPVVVVKDPLFSGLVPL